RDEVVGSEVLGNGDREGRQHRSGLGPMVYEAALSRERQRGRRALSQELAENLTSDRLPLGGRKGGAGQQRVEELPVGSQASNDLGDRLHVVRPSLLERPYEGVLRSANADRVSLERDLREPNRINASAPLFERKRVPRFDRDRPLHAGALVEGPDESAGPSHDPGGRPIRGSQRLDQVLREESSDPVHPLASGP